MLAVIGFTTGTSNLALKNTSVVYVYINLLGHNIIINLLDKLALWTIRTEPTKIVLTKNSPGVLVATVWS